MPKTGCLCADAGNGNREDCPWKCDAVRVEINDWERLRTRVEKVEAERDERLTLEESSKVARKYDEAVAALRELVEAETWCEEEFVRVSDQDNAYARADAALAAARRVLNPAENDERVSDP